MDAARQRFLRAHGQHSGPDVCDAFYYYYYYYHYYWMTLGEKENSATVIT